VNIFLGYLLFSSVMWLFAFFINLWDRLDSRFTWEESWRKCVKGATILVAFVTGVCVVLVAFGFFLSTFVDFEEQPQHAEEPPPCLVR